MNQILRLRQPFRYFLYLPWLLLFLAVGCEPGNNGSGSGASPAPVSSLSASVSPGTVAIVWSNPDDPAFAGVRICRSQVEFPADPSNCRQVYNGNASSYNDIEVGNGQSYYYTIWSYGTGGSFSAGTNFQPPSIPFAAPTRQPRSQANQIIFGKFAGSSGGYLAEPHRMFLTDSGILLVSDKKRNELLRVDPMTFRITEVRPMRGGPLGVARLGNEIFVGNEAEGSIEILDSNGATVGHLVQPGGIGYPGDLDVDSIRELVIVLDVQGQEVRVYHAPTRTLVGTIGAGALTNPSSLAVDTGNQEVLVSAIRDQGYDSSIHGFSYAAGNFGTQVKSAVISDCSFFSCTPPGSSIPQGMLIFGGEIFLVDGPQDEVLVFDKATLGYLRAIPSPDPETQDLRLPLDIEVNSVGDLFILSKLFNRVIKIAGGAL